MRRYKLILTAILCTLFISCAGPELADMNNNPNDSNSGGTGAEVFTSAIGYYGLVMDAFFHEDDQLYAQYVAGGPGVALLDEERYFNDQVQFNNDWLYCYSDCLSDLKFVSENAKPGLVAVSEIFSVLIYQNLVDHFGDIPYSEALKGTVEDGGIIAPKYDDDAAIYDSLILRLDAALAILENPDGIYTPEELAIGEEDVIFGLDELSAEEHQAKWIAFAYSLKLRLLMRQSITDASVGPAVIDLIANGTFIEDEDGLARIPYPADENVNPMFAVREGGVGQFYVASLATTDVLTELSDPRGLVIYNEAEGPGGLVGLKQGNINQLVSPKPADFSKPSSVCYGESNDVILMSHWEVYFLRAEAAMRFATADDEKAMYDAAVTAHFDYIGAEDVAAYLEGPALYDVGDTDLEKSDQIGVQKWISMNGLQESEGWIETRRFDQPPTNIFTNGIFYTPSESTLGEGIFPSIYLYPQSEQSLNPANVPTDREITDKVFWDN